MNLKFIVPFLILALIASPAFAETANKDLPTKGRLVDFLGAIPPADSYTKIASVKALEQHPDWKWDIWETNSNETVVSFYYTDPESKKGYGSLYFDDNGTDITEHLCFLKMTWIKGNKGIEKQPVVEDEPVYEENNTSDNISEPITAPESNNNNSTSNKLTFSFNVKNATSGEVASVSANLTKPSQGKIDDITESLRHLFYAIFGGN